MRWVDLLQIDNLINYILGIAFVKIFNEELIWLHLILEVDGCFFWWCVDQFVIPWIWTQIILVNKCAMLVSGLKVPLFSAIINVLAISIIAIIIIIKIVEILKLDTIFSSA